MEDVLQKLEILDGKIALLENMLSTILLILRSDVFTESVNKKEVSVKESMTNKRWTPEEEERLLDALKIGAVISTIANKHKRSVGAIRGRIELVVYQLYTKGKTIKDLAEEYKLSVEWVTNIITAKSTLRALSGVVGENTGKRWSISDKDRLMMILKDGSDLASISKDLKRTEGSVLIQLKMAINALIQAGATNEEILNKFHKSPFLGSILNNTDHIKKYEDDDFDFTAH